MVKSDSGVRVRGITLFGALLAVALMTGLLSACRGTISVGEPDTEREKAIAFYKDTYSIAKDIADTSVELNDFMRRSEVTGVDTEKGVQMFRGYIALFENDLRKLSELYAPPPLRQMRDTLAESLSTGIMAFTLGEMCMDSPTYDTCLGSDDKMLELNGLMMTSADEWDDGIAHYNIKSHELIP